MGQPLDLPLHRLIFGLHRRQTLCADKADTVADGRQALIGVVLPQHQPVLGAAGHHAVRLLGALGHQIVDEGADVAFAALEHQRLPAQQRQRRVDARHKALYRRLLIAGGAVELSRAVQPRHRFRLQRGLQRQRIDAVVLDGVGGAGHHRVLQPGNGVQHLDLHLLRQGGGETLNVQLLRVQPHRLDEQLMPGLVGKPHHLRLDGRTVPGPHALDDAAVNGAAVQILPDDAVGLLIGVGEVAHRPVLRRLCCLKAEGQGRGVSLLNFHLGKVHRPGVDPGRRAGLEPPQGKPQRQQTVRQRRGGVHTVGAALLDALADDGASVEIGAGADDHGPHGEHRSRPQHHLGHMAVRRADGHHLALPDGQMGLLLQRVLHHLLVLPAVRLGPQGPYGGPLAPVQHPVLDTGPVGGLCHLAPQGVQLPHQMALAGAADGGVAGHVAHRVQIDGKAHGFQSQTGGGQRRLDAGMARADDGNIKLSRNKLFHTRPSRQADEIRYSIIKYLLSKRKRDCAFC